MDKMDKATNKIIDILTEGFSMSERMQILDGLKTIYLVSFIKSQIEKQTKEGQCPKKD